MKKLLSLLLAATLVMSLTACGAKKEEAPAETEVSADAASTSEGDATIRILYASGDATQQLIMKEYIQPELAERFPNVTVEVEDGGLGEPYLNLVKTYNASGDLPDVWWAAAEVTPAVIETGNILELTDYITEDGFIDKYTDPEALKDAKGQIYTISPNTDPMHIPVMYYNRAIFEENGLSVPKTWEEFKNVCETLKANGITPISFCGGNESRRAIYVEALATAIDPTLVQDLCANKTDWSDPRCIEAYTYFKEMMDNGYFQEGFEAADHPTSIDIFTTGQAAMIYEFSWTNTQWDAENVGVFLFPSINPDIKTGEYVQCWGSAYNGYGVNAHSENKELAVAVAECCVEMQAKYFNEQGTESNLVTGIEIAEPNPVLAEINALRDGSTTRLKFLFANTMDSSVVAEWHTMNSTFIVGGYTPEQTCEEFNTIYADNTCFD